MFGVLVVRDTAGEIGFTAAFSGNLAGSNCHPYFVPPVYDMLRPGDLFRTEEAAISSINRQVEALEADNRYEQCIREQARLKEEATQAIAEAKVQIQEAKSAREVRREERPDEVTLAALARESQHQKAAFRRLKQEWEQHITAAQAETDVFTNRIEQLRAERKSRSAALQTELFRQFRLLNGLGESKDLCEIFAPTRQGSPPAGAGECAAPKLLQYALQNHLTPLSMAEFWWGASPAGEVRHHGQYYPACKGKCEPILHHVLQGLKTEPESSPTTDHATPEILYEDRWLAAVAKPAGMLSVPGKSNAPSVQEWAAARYPQATGPIIVHRLDMATSGILLLAKTKDVHRDLQAQFKNRTIQKHYVALLDGFVTPSVGRIELPLRPDPDDRPRQVIDPLHGKPAVTEYETIERRNGQTRIAFHPLTGRTHQLRVHTAHPLGLNAPITGDRLYGTPAERLFLHAERIEFRHPATGEWFAIDCPAEF